MVTYGTTAIPSDQIEVISGGTVDISAAFENTMVVVGGMDTNSGNATPGDLTTVSSPADAQTKFGDGSELHDQAKLAFGNGVGTLKAVPVTETSVSSETQGSQSGTLDNAPIFDPNVNGEHSITAADTSGTDPDVNVHYGSTPPTPSSDTINVNPVTGEYEADAAPAGDYEFDYEYGTYDSATIAKAVDDSPRIVALCTENESVVNTAATEVNDNATDFDFMHVVAGAYPVPDPTDTQTYTSNYSDGVDERRVSLVSPPRAYTDDAETNLVRTHGAVGGYLASLSLGLSATGDEIGGLTALRADFAPTDAGNIIDDQVLPLIDYPGIEIVKDMTTSTTQKFERVYGMQVIDEATEISHLISRSFIGEQNTQANRDALGRSHRNAYIGMREGTPKQLDDYTVNVTENTSNSDQVDVSIGLDIVDIMDIVDVTITVGDIIRNNGAS